MPSLSHCVIEFLQVMGLGEINLEDAEFMMRPRTITEVEVQLQKADPSIDVMKLVKARPHHAVCGCVAHSSVQETSRELTERWRRMFPACLRGPMRVKGRAGVSITTKHGASPASSRSITELINLH